MAAPVGGDASEMLKKICDVAESASHIKRACTGAPLAFDELKELRIEGSNRADFQSLLAVFYTVWKDRWQSDRRVFEKTSEPLKKFDRHFLDLRTPIFHSDVQKRQQEYSDDWIRKFKGSVGWQGCIDAFLSEAFLIVVELRDQFHAARSNSALMLHWRSLEESTPRSSVLAMCDALGLELSGKQLMYKTNSVTKRLSNRPPRPNQNLSALLDAYAVQELISWFGMRQLSVSYVELLESFSLHGDNKAVDLIRLAHIVENVTGKRKRELLMPILNESWSLLIKRDSDPR
jgi:hypothetical protein